MQGIKNFFIAFISGLVVFGVLSFFIKEFFFNTMNSNTRVNTRQEQQSSQSYSEEE